MTKKEEIENPNSCLNRAADDEPLFVLRAKDPEAAAKVREWCHGRVKRGKNQYTDPKIIEALQIADQMDKWRWENESK